LREQVEKFSKHHPLSELLRIRLAVLEGDAAQAARLVDLISANREYFRSSPGHFAAAAATLLWVRECEPVGTWITTLGYTSLRVRVVHDTQEFGRDTVLRVRFADGQLEFGVSDGFITGGGGELSVSRWFVILPLLERYVASDHFLPGEVFLNLGDAAPSSGLALCSSRPDSFLLPDTIFIPSKGYDSLKRAYLESDVPWGDRFGIAFWRGTLICKRVDAIAWQDLPRARACLIGRSDEAEGLIDAAVSGLSHASPEVRSAVEAAGIFRPVQRRPSARDMRPGTDFGKYKYTIDIDGNSNSWPGLFNKLCAGGAVLKVASPQGFRQWYYDRLEAWVNFVPVATDMSDLIDKVKWLRDNDAAAAAIGRKGRELAYAMTLETELERGCRTIAEAIRAASGQVAA
jgi:hypothetical protein